MTADMMIQSVSSPDGPERAPPPPPPPPSTRKSKSKSKSSKSVNVNGGGVRNGTNSTNSKDGLSVTFRMDNRRGRGGSGGGGGGSSAGGSTDDDDDDSPFYATPGADDSFADKMYKELSESGISGHDSLRSARSEATSNTDGDGGDEGDSVSHVGSVTNLQDRAALQTKKTLARNETKAVSCLRYVFLTILFCTAIGISLATYFYSKQVEKDNFHSEFDSLSLLVVRSFVDAIENKLSAMDLLSNSVTNVALSTGQTFPNVTIPNFETLGSTFRVQTDGIMLFYLPLVTDETRVGYEAYTTNQPSKELSSAFMFQSYINEETYRIQQDLEFGFITPEELAQLQAQKQQEQQQQQQEQQQDQVPPITQGGNPEEQVDPGTTGDVGDEDQGNTLLPPPPPPGPSLGPPPFEQYVRSSGNTGDSSTGTGPQPSDFILIANNDDGGGGGNRHRRDLKKLQHDDDNNSIILQQRRQRHVPIRRNLHAAGLDVHPVMHDGIWGFQNVTDVIEMPILPYNEGRGPYLPFRQSSPTIPWPSLLNFDFFDYVDLEPMLTNLLNSGKAVLGVLQTTHDGSSTEALIRTFFTLNQYRHNSVEYDADPMTQFSYPVFDTLNKATRKVSGVLVTTIFWRLVLENVLPDHVEGMIVVVSNTLGQSVTYRIDGRTATLLGAGDLHSNEYDDFVITRDLTEDISKRSNSPERASYTSVDLDTSGYTSYQIHVYPSEAMEDSYVTNQPVLYAIAIGCVFLFTSFVFLLYDFIVERRQSKVMDKAVKSTAVVSSLFPEAVHDRLFNDPQKSEELSKATSKDFWKNPNNANSQSGENNANTDREHRPSLTEMLENHMPPTPRSSTDMMKKKRGKPIADKLENATVLFADLAGFTNWSSTREPEQVFELLETIYGEFDRIALRRGVFKVETIGDCYMAATGVPTPQRDHAVRMVKFAKSCMEKLELILNDLEALLGPGTTELGMRVGIHSGSVTAGVLRGDKSRFQLFGDTVNTASRMESNGMKGRIHISQETADELIMAGKTAWLKTRQDKITAKGKGEMQTYWIDASFKARSSHSRASASSMMDVSGHS